MSKTIHMTLRQACKNQLDNLGGSEFSKTQFEDDIEECANRSSLKVEKRNQRVQRKFDEKQEF
ncbi:MAG: hypothetical protein JJ850_15300 [Kordiimonadaceae bacterium]|nr:hypothetical protein [Kordiimonadaceae bacterium]